MEKTGPTTDELKKLHRIYFCGIQSKADEHLALKYIDMDLNTLFNKGSLINIHHVINPSLSSV